MDEVVRFLLSKDHFLILTHVRPDGDTIGSACALCHGLRARGKTVCIAHNEGVTKRYLPYLDGCTAPEGYNYETVVSVDTASRGRLPEEYRGLSVGLSIDHHLTEEAYAGIHYTDSAAAAAGEIILDILTAMETALTPPIAAALYIAIATDTGCFKYANTTARSHLAAARLLETGLDVTDINHELFTRKTRARLQLETHIYQTMEFHFSGLLTLASLSMALIGKTEATEDDLDTLSALGRSVEGVSVSVLLREESGECKLSVRSSAPYRADLLCAQLGGGGHACAAGASLKGGLTEARTRVLNAAREVFGLDGE